MAHVDIKAGDGGVKVVATITDSATKRPMDLTGKTAQLRYSVNGGATVEKSMTVRNQTSFPGQVEYQFLTADLTAAGELVGEVRLQDGLSDQLTTVDEFHLVIGAPLP